jgi:hypothetical protein
VGIDIGAITPEEIAVAITAELIAVRRHASAALPHLSWFRGARQDSALDSIAGATTETIEEAIDEGD